MQNSTNIGSVFHNIFSQSESTFPEGQDQALFMVYVMVKVTNVQVKKGMPKGIDALVNQKLMMPAQL